MEFLATIKAPSPVFPNDQNAIVSVGADATVAQAFQVLIKNNIMSAPVFDYVHNKYCYMFSIRDVVNHALRVLDQTKFENEETPAMVFLTEKDHFRNYKVQDIVGKKDKLVEIGTDMTVDKVVELMVQTNAHRVVSLNADHSLNNIITQSRVVEVLSDLWVSSSSLGKLGKKSITEIEGFVKTDGIVSINENEKAVDAFRKICEHNISGLPVTNSDGVLVGNISEGDLRAIQSNASYLKMLYTPIIEYLDLMSKHQLSTTTSIKGRSIVKCTANDTYRDVVERIAESRVHRCYMVDASDKLVGVISLHNILAALVKFS